MNELVEGQKPTLIDIFRRISGDSDMLTMLVNEQLSSEVASLTLANHATDFERYVGADEGQGIQAYGSLNGQKALNVKGIPVAGKTTRSEAFTDGEEGVSFEVGNLSGYGEVFFVMPLSVPMTNGGTMSIFDPPSEITEENKIGGIYGYQGEADIYPLFATVLARLGRLNDFVHTLDKADRTDINFKRRLLEFGLISEEEGIEIIEKRDLFETRVNAQYEELRELMVLTEEFDGININVPFVLVLMPEKHREKMERIIGGMADLRERNFFSNQIIYYDNDLDEDDEIDNLLELFENLKDPEYYATMVLANMRTCLDNESLEVEDLIELLKNQETLLRRGRVRRDFTGYVFAPSQDPHLA